MKWDPTAPQGRGFESRSGRNGTERRLRAAGSNPDRGETEPNGASGPRVRIPLGVKRDPTAPQGRGFESRSGRNGTERRLRAAGSNPARGETGPNGASGPRVRIPLGAKRNQTAPQGRGFESRSGRNGTQWRLRAAGSNPARGETRPNGASGLRVRIPLGEKRSRNGTQRRLRPRVRIPIGAKPSRNGAQRRLRAAGSNPAPGKTRPNGASEPRVRIPLGEKRDPMAPQGPGSNPAPVPSPRFNY